MEPDRWRGVERKGVAAPNTPEAGDVYGRQTAQEVVRLDKGLVFCENLVYKQVRKPERDRSGLRSVFSSIGSKNCGFRPIFEQIAARFSVMGSANR
jgi:hypothetical protein